MFVDIELSAKTSQQGVYEKAQGVQNYEAFAPLATAQHGGTNGSAASGPVQDTQMPRRRDPALDVVNYAAFAPPPPTGGH